MFDNFTGKGYGDNPKYIAEQLRHKGYDLVWFVDNLSKDSFPDGIRTVKIHSIRGLYNKATAKVWVDNIRHYHPVKKRKNQIYLQTWHGAYGPKLAEKDAYRSLNEQYIKTAQYDGQISDGILVSGKLEEELFLRTFWLGSNTKILRFGLPRSDELIRQRNIPIRQHKQRLGLDPEAYYILYAPTFRDNHSLAAYDMDYPAIIKTFETIKKRKCYLIIRLHPHVAYKANQIPYTDNILNGSGYSDMQSLLIACDCLITDYSSTSFDFEMLKKPVFLYCSDLEAYEKKRGLSKEFYKYPFPFARTNDDLIYNIIHFDEKTYQDNMDEYMKNYPSYEDGHAAERTAKWIEDKMINDK